MTATLQLSQPPNTTAEIISLLTHYQMMPQLLREIIIDQAIAEITCTPEEQAIACGQFYQQHQLVGEQERQAWLKRHGFTLKQLAESVIRELKIEKFKQATWESQLESYFLTRKGQWDKVIYSVIHVKDRNLAQELYFRIAEGEQSFSELAKEYSQGPEAQTGGLLGPYEVGRVGPPLDRLLPISQPGQLWSLPLGEWVMIVRLEKLIPAQLDQPMCQRMYRELFEVWLEEQCSGLCSKTVVQQKLFGST